MGSASCILHPGGWVVSFGTMKNSVRISFSDVAKRYDLRVVFRSVSGEAVPGEILIITGPNGSGKSTLLAILCGLLRPSRGKISHLLNGNETAREEWRHHLGVVAPAMSVYEELDAMENLRFFARVRGMGVADSRCHECLELVGLDPERRTPVRGYSTGMAQRLKIAQALLHDPAVLFLDEPGSNLDPAGKVWLGGYIQELTAAGKTLVVATNDREEMKWGEKHVALAG
jgi:ABC-type multidrug transport system ATPase subunit